MKKKSISFTQPNVSLDEQIKQAKLRAQHLDLARDTIEWRWLLRACGVSIIWGYVEVSRINDYLIRFEQEQVRLQKEGASGK